MLLTTSSWFGISKDFIDVTLGGDHVASFDAKQVEDIDENVKLFAVIITKINP